MGLDETESSRESNYSWIYEIASVRDEISWEKFEEDGYSIGYLLSIASISCFISSI